MEKTMENLQKATKDRLQELTEQSQKSTGFEFQSSFMNMDTKIIPYQFSLYTIGVETDGNGCFTGISYIKVNKSIVDEKKNQDLSADSILDEFLNSK